MPTSVSQRFIFCPLCGGSLVYKLRKSRPRLTCHTCAYVWYENPVVGVAGILLNANHQILLGRRKSTHSNGLWCIPCGYLEYHEDLYQGIRREFKEETNLDIEVRKIFTAQSNFHDPDKHSVGIWFLVEAVSGDMKAGDDLDAIAFFDFSSPPPLAFSNDSLVLNLLLKTGD